MIAPNLGTSAKPLAHKGHGFTRRGRNAIACPAKVSAGANGVCPSKKDACPHKGWPVPRFGLMVGLGL
jgi:hypothetical protein